MIIRQDILTFHGDSWQVFGDVLIHAYEGVDLQRVWKIAKEDLPQVKAAISRILPPLEQLEQELAGDNAEHG